MAAMYVQFYSVNLDAIKFQRRWHVYDLWNWHV